MTGTEKHHNGDMKHPNGINKHQNGNLNHQNGDIKFQNGDIKNIIDQNRNAKCPIDDPMAIVLPVEYQKLLEKYWSYIPNSLGPSIAALAVFIFGATARGDWIHLLAHFIRAYYTHNSTLQYVKSEPYIIFGIDLEPYYLKDWLFYLTIASTISYLFFFGIGGFLHWYYYVNRRDKAHEWKCQPSEWLSPELEKHEIMVGTFSLTIGSFISSLLSCYILNGGWTMLYYDLSEHSLIWYAIQWPFVFIWQDYLTYWFHRIYHTPFLYKNFHKLHHKYKQPTAFSVTAIHPIEFIHMQSVLISPMFIFPIHYSVFCTCLMYLYYHGIIDHSGINFKAYWWQPWQPDCIFHDNHHQYFHVNFGFNCELWDKIHGTYRQNNKIYREDIYYGKGKGIEECTEEELTDDLKERKNENILAYRGNVHKEQLDDYQKLIKKKI